MTRFFSQDQDFVSASSQPEEAYEDEDVLPDAPIPPDGPAEDLSHKRARLLAMLRDPGTSDVGSEQGPSEPVKTAAPVPQPTQRRSSVQVNATRPKSTLSKSTRPEPKPKSEISTGFWEDGPDEFSFGYQPNQKVYPKPLAGSDLTILTAEKGVIVLEDGTTLIKSGKTLAVCPRR